jgi:hypothetical protein
MQNFTITNRMQQSTNHHNSLIISQKHGRTPMISNMQRAQLLYSVSSTILSTTTTTTTTSNKNEQFDTTTMISRCNAININNNSSNQTETTTTNRHDTKSISTDMQQNSTILEYSSNNTDFDHQEQLNAERRRVRAIIHDKKRLLNEPVLTTFRQTTSRVTKK